jgi:crotonobetainyl-CoA:carnitine CoA-transferase CaiB-like acyl-CoA transferase
VTALDGITVLDLTRLLPGAVATQWLADFGAQVIKVEQPGVGDYARHNFADGGDNPIFALTNQGKKSVTINLKDPPGAQAFLKLAKKADVVIEGFRPDVMDRLGLGYETLAATNPRLIYVALTGYGAKGKYPTLAGHDINYLALSGVLDLMGAKDGPPALAGIQIADLAGGSMQAVIGILLALEARHRTNRGQRVDISMFAGSAAMMPIPIAALVAGHPVERGAGLLNGGFACYQVYGAAEGSYVAVGALEPKFWANLCRELKCEELIAEQFCADQSRIKTRLSAIFQTASAEEWFVRIGTKDCCVTPVRTLAESAADYPTAPIPALSETPGTAAKGVPELGEHNNELL